MDQTGWLGGFGLGVQEGVEGGDELANSAWAVAIEAPVGGQNQPVMRATELAIALIEHEEVAHIVRGQRPLLDLRESEQLGIGQVHDLDPPSRRDNIMAQ